MPSQLISEGRRVLPIQEPLGLPPLLPVVLGQLVQAPPVLLVLGVVQVTVDPLPDGAEYCSSYALCAKCSVSHPHRDKLLFYENEIILTWAGEDAVSTF